MDRSEKILNITKWPIESTEEMGNFRVFKVIKQISQSPSTGKSRDFYVLDCPDWVNIIPITLDNKVVFVEQYRQGIDDLTLEIPGGAVDKTDNLPRDSARRELQEETGYDSDQIIDLGCVNPNPAIQNNRCHFFLAKNVEKKLDQNLDAFEEINTLEISLNEIPNLIRSGKIKHSLVVCAFHLLQMHMTTSH